MVVVVHRGLVGTKVLNFHRNGTYKTIKTQPSVEATLGRLERNASLLSM